MVLCVFQSHKENSMKSLSIIILLYSLAQASAVQWCEKDIYEAQFHTPDEELEVLVIWFPVRAGAHNVLQLCSNHTGQPVERHCSYNRMGTNATWDAIDKQTKLINCSLIVNQCMEEPFTHNYIMKNKVKTSFNNMWQIGGVGEEVTLKEPCLLSNGLPLTRKCFYEPKHYMAQWEPIQDNGKYKDVSCLRDIKQNIVTFDLNKLCLDIKEGPKLNDTERLAAATELTDLLAKNNTLRISADIMFSTEILEIITLDEKKPEMVPKIVGITDLLMQSDVSAVNVSSELNAPNRLMQTVEQYLDGMTNLMVPTSQCENIVNGVKYQTANMTSYFMMNPFCSNLSGIAIYSSEIITSAHRPSSLFYDTHTNSYIRFLYLNQSLAELLTYPHLQVAGYFPQALWEKLLTETAGKANVEGLRFSIYKNGYFFVDKRKNGHMPEGIVLTISIPGYKGDLPDDLPFIIRHSQLHSQEKPKCGYWDYHTWQSIGVSTTNHHMDNLVLCQTSHLTPFTLFVGVGITPLKTANDVVLKAMDESVLDIISIIGCGLSLFGLMCIWMTAICFKQWRSQSSNKVLLNMCFVLTLITVYFLFINMTEIRDSIIDMKNKMHCIAMGAFLHYTILVLFAWMLIVAILQYQRYVVVLGIERPSHFVVKYSLAAWGCPIIPTAAVAYFDPNAYKPQSLESYADNNTICYPSGYSLYYGVMLPITVIIVANIGIFLYIICSIRRSLNIFKKQRERQNLIMQLRLSILLFFLLGISWVFGLLAHLSGSIIFAFLFCLTSTLQGFVLFIYFVVVDQSTRYTWLKCCCAKNYYTMEESSMTPLTYFNSSHN